MASDIRYINKKIGLFCFFLYFSFHGIAQDWKVYPHTPEGSRISFPKDEGRHPNDSVEWWYISGHLLGETTNTSYSFLITYFFSLKAGFDGFRIFNLSNDDTGEFYTETMPLNYKTLSTDSLNILAQVLMRKEEYWRNKADLSGKSLPFEYILSAATDSNALTLEINAQKSPLIIADSGFLYQGEDSYTYYYSQTKNTVDGTITINNTTETVNGTSWIDRQYGNFNPSTGQEYEWFCIQLSNGMDLNTYNIFTADNKIPDNLRYKIMAVYKDSLTQFTTFDFELERLAFQYMPDSLRCYCQKWKLTSPEENIDLIITTRQNNSEVLLPFRFFEGSTIIEGTVNGAPVTGEGFTELLHSYEKPELSITYPTSGNWNYSSPITWQLNNFDEGRPLKYDLEYSTDQKQSFTMVSQALSDTFYLWNSPPVSIGDSCWFRITGYSVDSTLKTSVTSSDRLIVESPKILASPEALHIYPNPADQLLTIELNNNYKLVNYRITDTKGQIILQKQVASGNKFSVDVSSLSSGTYFIEITTSESKIVSGFVVR
jgi:predicted secreted hydrolase